jgi:hypothetical protein
MFGRLSVDQRVSATLLASEGFDHMAKILKQQAAKGEPAAVAAPKKIDLTPIGP